jgi:solute carrier family 41
MLLMVVPGQLVFLLVIQQLQAGHTTISAQFVVMYLIVSLIQVGVLLQVCQWMVIRFWKKEQDPDNYAIPYLTALGDLLGTGLLALGFYLLWLLGDRDQDVGD